MGMQDQSPWYRSIKVCVNKEDNIQNEKPNSETALSSRINVWAGML